MHRSWTIGRKLTAAFGVIAFLLATASVASLVDTYRSKRSQERTTAIAAASRAAAELEAFTRGLDGNQKLILVAGLTGVVERSEAGLKGVKTASTEIAKRLDLLSSAARDAKAREQVAALGAEIATWHRHHAALLALVEKQDFDNAITLDLGDSFAAQTRVMEKAEQLQATFGAEAQANQSDAQRTFAMSIGIAVAVILAAFVVGIIVAMVVRSITKALATAASGLRMSAQQVSSTSEQVASSSQSLSQGATEQAASLEETSASMEEMASMTRKNAENAHAAAGQVAETERLVLGANTALAELVTSMVTIRDSSSQVTKIIKTIDEIAFQTNILALNAAVEAARAGEAGMGFAVVADEVRNLAQRSAQAAKDTASLIEASAQNAASGGTKVDAVVTAMSAITASSSRVRSLIEEVSVASRQQSQGIDQVTQALAQMEKVTQTTAATAEESAAASQELHSQAGQSMAVVEELEEMVHGTHGGAVTTSRRAGQAAPVAAAQSESKNLKLVPRTAPASRPTAEEQIPFDDTGTFGRF